jgi:4-alpha-glucanotransferase
VKLDDRARLLEHLAQRVGIQPSHLDMTGRTRAASPRTLAALLQIWGIPAGNRDQIRSALREQDLLLWRRAVDPVIVAWDGRPVKTELRLPASLQGKPVKCRLAMESGEGKPIVCRPKSSRISWRIKVGREEFIAQRLALPRLPEGYHELRLEAGGQIWSSSVISAPTRGYSPPAARKSWGAFLPMYAARSEQSLGAGSLGDWQRLSEWVASQGGKVMATLPLLAAFLDYPTCEPSPYSPASRLFWNEFYLDLPRVPEFARCGAAQALFQSSPFRRQIENFRQSELIDYRAEYAARRQVLELLAAFFFRSDSPRQRQFRRFLRERPLAEEYARFRAVCERTKTSWRNWDDRLRQGILQPGDYRESDKNYHLYVQWLAQERTTEFLKQCRASDLRFYLDLPLGVHPDGFDVWRERDAFALPASAGAPPDMFFSQGQDWGFSPLHPGRIREMGYRYLIDSLRFQMRHATMLRIDHVMGLHRLYWIPQGFPAAEGAYVSYAAEELFAILNLESHRCQTILVGENLGTVPPEVNQAMARHGLRQMCVVQFEVPREPGQPLRPPPARAVASVNTHDTPPFAAYWRGLDLELRAELGLISRTALRRELSSRRKQNLNLANFLRRKGWLKGPVLDERAVLRACLAWLGASPAEVVLVNLEDLWLETHPQNVPGTSTERPNWRRKARLTIEQIQWAPGLRETLAVLNQARLGHRGA